MNDAVFANTWAYTKTPEEIELGKRYEAQNEFMKWAADKRRYLVMDAEAVEAFVMRDDEGRPIALTVALQGEGEFMIPLHRNGDRPAK